MYTDGKTCYIKRVENSEVSSPQFIAEVKFNFNKSLFVVRYASTTNQFQSDIKAFKKIENNKWEQFNDENIS